MTFIKYLAWTIVALFVLIPSLILGLVATNTGSVWLINQAIKFTDSEFSYATIEGDLLTQLRITNSELNTASIRFSATTLELAWEPMALLDQQVVINKAFAKHATIWLKPSASQDDQDAPITLPELSLPVVLNLKQFKTQDIRLAVNEKEQILPDINAQITWHNQQIDIKKLNLSYQNVVASFAGTVSTANNYPLDVLANWTVSEPLSNANISQIIGRTEMVGNTNRLTINSRFKVDDASIEQFIGLRAQDLLGNLTWLGEIELASFELKPLVGMIFPDNNELQSLFQNATLDLSATVDDRQAIVESLAINDVSNNQGSLVVTGSLSNYLQAKNEPASANLKLSAIANDITLPRELFGIVANLKTVAAEANGNLSDYTYQLNFIGDVDQYNAININSNGSGSLTHLNIAQVTVASTAINGRFSGESNWKDGFLVKIALDEFQAQLPQLANYSSSAITASGHLSYQANQINADEFLISWADNNVILSGGMQPNSPLVVAVDIPNLDIFKLNAYLTGSAKAELELIGTLDKQLDIGIRNFNLNHPDFGQWQTTRSGSVKIPLSQPMAFAANNVCLLTEGRRNNGEICLDTTTNKSIQTTTIRGSDLPLSLLNQLRTTAMAERIWGLVDLDAKLAYDLNDYQLVQTNGKVYSEQTVLFALDDEISTRFEYWELAWSGDSSQLSSTLFAELEKQQGNLLGDLEVTDPFNTAKLNGEVLLDVQDLTVLQWVLPDLRYENAQAVGAITISGDKAAPRIQGSLELAAQEIGFAQTGLVLTNVRVAAFDSVNFDNEITLTGQAESGGGWISIDGSLRPLEPSLAVNISGENFRAVQLPTITVDISPSIDITLANKRIDITGEITIPSALIDQPEIEATAVTPSQDVKVYDNGEPVTPENGLTTPIYANVRVNLGDDVKVTAFGFDGQLAGSIRVNEEPNRALTATGSIQVKKGFYELYGQRLEIDRGSLIYSGGPINNPGLDLRVSRAKENMLTTEDITVGAQISGTIQEPDFRLYSTPAMPDSEVLSYLILGRGSGATTEGNENLQLQALILLGSKGTDIIGDSLQDTFGFDEFGIDSSMNPNDTSFYIGKYLSPKLYVKYGVGLFENTNTFLIRYLLSEHFIIETTASGEAQGGDIFYTIEK